MNQSVEALITELLKREGGFVNDPNDSGGATNYGITRAALAAWRQRPVSVEDVRRMTEAEARSIYERRYYIDPGFFRVSKLSASVAAELTDTGVNMGPGVAVRFLQEALNALNARGTLYADIAEDGQFGKGTEGALASFLARRGSQGEKVLLKVLNVLQGARYLELSRARQKDEAFVYGWFNSRISL